MSGYEITRNGEVLDTRDGLSLFITDFQPGTVNGFAITSISSAGERSSSVSASIDTGSATPPFSSAILAAPTGYRGAFDALVVEQGDTRETLTASSIQDNSSEGQIGSSDRYNVRRYLRIENGEYDYKQGEVEVVVRDWNHRFNRFDPDTGQHTFNRLNATFTVSASWTDGQTLEIDVVFDGRGEEAHWFDSGRLRIVSDTGDFLEVLAGTGDPETYQLVSTVNGVTLSEIRRWDINGCELVNTYWQQELDREQCVLMPPLG